jgi:hypothetical protein
MHKQSQFAHPEAQRLRAGGWGGTIIIVSSLFITSRRTTTTQTLKMQSKANSLKRRLRG